MKSSIKIFFTLIVAAFFTTCDKEDAEVKTEVETGFVQINFTPTINGMAYQVNDLETGFLNYRYRFETLKFFISNISAKNSTGQACLKDVELLNLAAEPYLTLTLEATHYSQLAFDIGVPAKYNVDQDPTVFEPAHPLSYNRAVIEGMHWSWNTGYIFFKIDGKTDTNLTADVEPNHPFFFHVGHDNLLETIMLDKPFSVTANDTAHVNIQINLNSLFFNTTDSIDIRLDSGTHTNDNYPLAERITPLFINAFE